MDAKEIALSILSEKSQKHLFLHIVQPNIIVVTVCFLIEMNSLMDNNKKKKRWPAITRCKKVSFGLYV